MSTTALAPALAGKRVLICVGSGGVGKTTAAASLALRAAVVGRSSLVCTIDPAKRLANSLGLASGLGNTETQVPATALEPLGITPKAALYAMMLDMKQTWDDLITRVAPPDQRERILSNRFYQSLSTALAGSQEYISMEKLWELRRRSAYELIVLDTPPTAHALDFLDAPNRVLDFLDNEAAKWLLNPALKAGKLGMSLFNKSGYVMRALAKFTGTEMLQELSNFMLAISSMNEGFRERARGVRQLLEDPSTGFVLVTSPHPERMDEAIHFHTLLKQHRMEVVALVVNRVHPMPPEALWEDAATLTPTRRAKVEETLRELQVMAEQDAKGLAQLRAACPDVPLIRVPRFELDVHDITALWRTGRYLLGDDSLD